ncbi:MAG: AarF/ABC1/UbiB kinase family protein [Parvularculaceae bacterium]|nr:AarF/ABC1/UbiB kinase family protein [Parvularculaceae bacterium]
MTSDSDHPRGVRIPKGRAERLASFGGLATGIAGSMLVGGARAFVSGARPSAKDLLLTPTNAKAVADELAKLRGAAMKAGQLLSMDAGDFVPPELAEMFARLRAMAEPMPGGQLRLALERNWGRDWLRRFERFDVKPIAAASIGQVHRAQTKDGRDLAVKVQYPGVKESIDSDIDNLASLLKLSGLLPNGLDIAPVLADAKRQLKEEADYGREGAMLDRYRKLLASDASFLVPALHADLTTPSVLAMDYASGDPIELLEDADQETRDGVMARLIGLTLRELFEFRLMQTDPNFANYRFDRATGKLVLLDFGATREFGEDFIENYRRLMSAGLRQDGVAVRTAALEIGLFDTPTMERHEARLLRIFDMALEPLRQREPFDFGASDLSMRLRDEGVAFNRERELKRLPPTDALFIHRKVGGMYLLATRLRARVDIRPLVERFL